MTNKKIKLITIHSVLLLSILLFSNIDYISADQGQGDVNIHPGTIKFDIKDPVDDVPANHNLTLSRKKMSEKDVYYRVIDKYVNGINLAEYVMAKTPYVSGYQELDNPVRFLATEDENVEISLKLRIDSQFWDNVSDGEYDLDLVSDKGRSVKIRIFVNKSSLFTVTPRTVNILADDGPGVYGSQNPVNIYVNSNNRRWNIDIEANPLIYQGNLDSSPVMTRDIYLSVNSSNNYISLDNLYRLTGSNYGKKANIELYFQVDVGNEHFAGDYSGEVVLTISEY